MTTQPPAVIDVTAASFFEQVVERSKQVPVLVVECEGGLPAASERESLTEELLSTARALTPTAKRVVHVLFHPSFPVDVRHNAKIHRLELRDWAARQL